MKTSLKLLLAALVGLLFAVACFAQDSAAASAPVSPAVQSAIAEFLAAAVVKWPVLSTIIAVIGSMRLWAKPVFGLLHQIVELTPTKWDDGLWAKAYDFFTRNSVGVLIAWALDYFGSIKVIPPGSIARPKIIPE